MMEIASEAAPRPLAKYLYKPFFGSSHQWALRAIRSMSRFTSLLDIGAGSGAIGRELQDLGYTNTTAVEIDEEARNHIRPFYRTVQSALEEVPENEFDIVLLLDVLEHVTDPFGMLNEVLRRLKPGGELLLSVPNIAHWSVRAQVLFGKFEYTERGILDKTHFRFFTVSSLRHLIDSFNNVQILTIGASIAPVEFLLPEIVWQNPVFAALSKIRHRVAQSLPGLFGYQILVRIKRIT